jgi:hypothetical protein
VIHQRGPDRASGGINVYAYVSNNPVSFNDPFGLEKNDPWISGATRTPAKGGPPGGKVSFPDGKGGRTDRHYGPNSRAERDVDHGHDHNGAGDPHVHDWDWSKDSPRQPGRPPHPGEHLRNANPKNPWSPHVPTMEEIRLREQSEHWRQRYYETWLYYSAYAATLYLTRGLAPVAAPRPIPAPVP